MSSTLMARGQPPRACQVLSGRIKLLETEATTKLIEAQAMLMAEETKIMLTDLETISDPARREWLENRQKSIRERQD
jgi:hypothetical protein